MTRKRVLAVSLLAIVTVTVGVVGHATVGAARPPSEIWGVGFQIKSQDDQNFCITVDNGTPAGRKVTLQLCSGADTQRWVLTHNADGSNFLVESLGMCLDGRFSKANIGVAQSVQLCSPAARMKFRVLSTGLIQTAGRKCLLVPGAASNAQVSLNDCDPNGVGQRWTFTK